MLKPVQVAIGASSAMADPPDTTMLWIATRMAATETVSGPPKAPAASRIGNWLSTGWPGKISTGTLWLSTAMTAKIAPAAIAPMRPAWRSRATPNRL